MCKFHQDVALDVALNPDGTVDPVAYAINIVALSASFSVKQLMPSVKGIKGDMTYKMASKSVQDAFEQSDIRYDPDAFAAYRNDTLGFLKEKTQESIKAHQLNTKRPKILEKGIKAFLYQSPDEIDAPFDNLSPSVFKNPKDAAEYQELRLATADYLNHPDVKDVLGKHFKQSVAVTFKEAAEKANPALLKVYEAMPDKLKQFSTHMGGVCASAGGTVLWHLAHLASIVQPSLLPTLGTFSVFDDNPVGTYGMMIGGSCLGIGAWQYMHYKKGTLPTTQEKFITYGLTLVGLGVSTALQVFGNGHTHSGSNKPSTVTYFNDQAGRQFMVREDMQCIGDSSFIKADTFQISGPEMPQQKLNP